MSVETPKDWERDILDLADRIARSDDQTRRILWDGVTRLIHQVEGGVSTASPQISRFLRRCRESSYPRWAVAEQSQQLAKLLIIRRYIEQIGKTLEGVPPSARPVPPAGACFLLGHFLSRADRQGIPGDLEEEFAAKSTKYGPRAANVWFWRETVKVIAIRNPICRSILVGGLMRLGEWIFRQIGG